MEGEDKVEEFTISVHPFLCPLKVGNISTIAYGQRMFRYFGIVGPLLVALV